MEIKKLFFKEDPTDQDKSMVTKEQDTKPQTVQAMNVSPQMVSNITGVADEKFVEMLTGVIGQNNIPGQDYFEFKQTLDAMASLPIDEKNKFLTIFTTFKLQGCSKETLMTSIDKYISVINNEMTNFNSELVSQRESTVAQKLSQVEEARKKVESLNKEISDLNAFIITTTQEAQNSEIKLQMTEANFTKSVEKVIGMLNSDKEKINTYLQ